MQETSHLHFPIFELFDVKKVRFKSKMFSVVRLSPSILEYINGLNKSLLLKKEVLLSLLLKRIHFSM